MNRSLRKWCATIMALLFATITLQHSLYAQKIEKFTRSGESYRAIQEAYTGSPLPGSELQHSAPELHPPATIADGHEEGYWSLYTMSNTGELPLTNTYYSSVFQDSRGRYFAVGANIDVWDGQFWRTLHVGKDLPGSAFRATSGNIVEDQDGNIYVGTGAGLVKFDPELNKVDEWGPDNPDLKSPYINTLMVANDGNLWIGHPWEETYEGGITVFTDSGATFFHDELIGHYIEDIHQRQNGDIWVSIGPNEEGNFGGINVYDGSGWSSFTEDNSGLPHNEATEMTEDRDGNMWVGLWPGRRDTPMPGGVVKYDGSNWTHYTTSDGLADGDTWSIFEASDGTIYVGSADATVAFDGSAWNTVKNGNSTFPLTSVTGMYEAVDGDLLFSTARGNTWGEGGIHSFDGSEWDYISNMDDGGLHSNVIFGSDVDTAGNIWVAGFYGANMYDGEEWHYFNRGSGMAHTYAWKVKAASDGSVWLLTTRNGLTKYQNGKFTVYDEHGVYEEAAFEDSEENMWFGAYNWPTKTPEQGGVLMYDGSNFTSYDSTDGLIGNNVTAIGEGPAGRIYAATDAGLAVFDGSSWSEQAVDGLTGNGVNEILSDSENNLWIDTQGSLIMWDGSSWTTYTTADGYAGFATEMREGMDGTIWMAGNGLQAFREGVFHTFPAGHGHPSELSFTVLPVADGAVFAGTYSGGLARYDMAAPVAVTDVADLPNDEGGWVTIHAEGYLLDAWRVTQPEFRTATWTVWRLNGEQWEAAATSPITGELEPRISVQVPTTMPTGSDDPRFEYQFKITAHASDGRYLGESEPLSGYAVDNLAPAPVNDLQSTVSGNEMSLSWQPSPAGDIGDYRVYESVDGEIALDSPVVTTTSTSVKISGDDAVGKNYVVVARDRHNNFSEASDPVKFTSLESGSRLPEAFALEQNYPNPFNPSTTIRFAMPEAGSVTLSVFNISGQKVAELLKDENRPAGWHQVSFDAGNISSGIYFYRLTSEQASFTRKMILMK